ncbi:MAG: hypothetical protein QS748_00585 [Candidatus Endonucleobacter bathymodioli]|uniref:Uncharacterized protein n=1 Tax=Candidatus Endonucleibacter bathymodioli TaxID=539814 RepID=A0AA90SC93_9GAMM|nr:hypothetical protein [Candidatus Endonucleobacter bathymodioli]
MKYTVSAQAYSKSATDVTAATIALLKPIKDLVHTITADNGSLRTMRRSVKRCQQMFILRTPIALGSEG